MVFLTRYSEVSVVGLDCKSPSMTEQHHKEDLDINNIFARFLRTGTLGDSAGYRFGDYVDVTGLPSSLMEAQQQIIDAENKFNSLPAKVRLRFNNNAAELFAFLENPANYEEAVSLNLVTRRASESEVGTKTPLDINVPTDTKPEVQN